MISTIALEYEHECKFNEQVLQTIICMDCSARKKSVKNAANETCDCDRFDLLMEHKCGTCEIIKKELNRLEGEIRLKFHNAAEHLIVNMELANNFQNEIEKLNNRRLQLKNTLIYQQLKRAVTLVPTNNQV